MFLKLVKGPIVLKDLNARSVKMECKCVPVQISAL